MAVDGCRNVNAGMSQALAYDRERHAIGEQLATVRVAQRVETGTAESGFAGEQANFEGHPRSMPRRMTSES